MSKPAGNEFRVVIEGLALEKKQEARAATSALQHPLELPLVRAGWGAGLRRLPACDHRCAR